MYECEAENQLKVSKAFLNIDGKTIDESISMKRKTCFFFSLFLSRYDRNNCVQYNNDDKIIDDSIRKISSDIFTILR